MPDNGLEEWAAKGVLNIELGPNSFSSPLSHCATRLGFPELGSGGGHAQ